MKIVVATMMLLASLVQGQYGRNYFGYPSFPTSNYYSLPRSGGGTFAVYQPQPQPQPQPQQQVFPEWFRSEDDDPEECEAVPDEVNTGPIEDLCEGAEVGTRFCVCVKRGNSLSSAYYHPMCGECKDPCALKFEADKYPRKRRRDDDDEDSNENQNQEIN